MRRFGSGSEGMQEGLSNGCRPGFSGFVPRLERILLTNIVPFWLATLDHEQGGYLIGHDHGGRPRPEANKGVVTQARQVWLMARLARSEYGRPEHLEAARWGYRFLHDSLWDAEYGGFFWEVDATGRRPLRTGKHLYGQAFGLFALAEYYRVSRDESARALAETCLDLIVAKGRDGRHGGYVESLERDWRPGRDDARSYLGVAAGVKTMNAHLHLLEAVTAWQRVVPSAQTRERLSELFGLMSRWALQGGGDEYSADWRPIGSGQARVSYGHHLENIWLLLDAADALGEAPSSALLGGLRARFAACLEGGYDFRRGGVFEYGPKCGQATGRDKLWWVQAEALLACLYLYRATGTAFYRAIFRRILGFIEERQVDWRHGEWHARVLPDGPAEEDKAHLWKEGYHNGRAMIESLAGLKQGWFV